VPYAALDVAPEALLVRRLLGQIGARPTLKSLPTRRAKAGELLKRGAVGAGVGAPAEGLAEAGQEALLLGLSDQELGSADGIKRLTNAFAAGAAAGSVLGAGANVLNPTNLLEPGKGTEPSAGTVDVTPKPEQFPPGPMVQGQLDLVGGEVVPGYVPLTMPVPAEAPTSAGLVQPEQMALFEPTAVPISQRGVMPTGPMVQGELPLVGGQVAPGYVPPSVSPTEVPTVPETGLTPEEAAAQGALQFAPEAPEPPGGGTMANRLREIQDQLRREREFSTAQAQLLAQREAELEALAQQSLNARDIFEMEQRPPLPMVPATPRAPRQLPLFPPGALPGPTRRERQAAATPLAEIPPGATRLRQPRAERRPQQMELPYVAAPVTLEAAKDMWDVQRPSTVRRWESLSEESQQKWVDAITAGKATPAVRAKISREETQARLTRKKEKPSAVQEQGAATVPAQPGAEVGEGVGAEVPGQAPPTGKGAKLKRGKEAKPRKPLKKEPPPPKPEEAVAPPPPPPPPPPTKTAEEIEAETAAARAEIEAERANAEAQWNNERLPSDVAFADLPAAAQKEWQESDRSGAAQIVITQKLLADGYELDMTITERLNFALAAATAALDGANFAQFNAPTVVDVIVEVAYFTPGNYKKEQIDDALEFLSDPLEFSDAHLEAIADSFVDLAGGRTLEAKTKATKAGGEGGADKAWYTYAKDTPGVMQRLANRGVVFRMLTDEEARAYVESTVLSRQNLPDAQAKRLFGEEVSAKEDAESDPKNSPLTKLLRLITDINTSTVPYTESLVKQRQRELKALYAKVLDLDLDTKQVSPFFDAAGNPYTISVNKVMRVVTKAEATKEEATRREAVLKEQEAANKATKTDTINSFDDFVARKDGQPGRNFVDIDGKPITKPLAIGRVRMVLANFLSKLVVKPKVYVYRSQADLKATNPRLYERAAAARPQGDFDRTPSKRVRLRQQRGHHLHGSAEDGAAASLRARPRDHRPHRPAQPHPEGPVRQADARRLRAQPERAEGCRRQHGGPWSDPSRKRSRSTCRTSPQPWTSASSTGCGTPSRAHSTASGSSSATRPHGTGSTTPASTSAPDARRCSPCRMLSRRSMRLRPARTQTTSAASPPRATCATTTSPPACSTTTWAGCPAALPKHGRPPRGSSATGRMAGTGSRPRSSACSTSAPGRTPACLLWSGCSARRVVCRCRSRTRSTRSWPSSPTSPWPTSQRGCPGSVASRRTNWHRPTSCCTTHSGMLPAG
jgi:hypothetical protein